MEVFQPSGSCDVLSQMEHMLRAPPGAAEAAAAHSGPSIGSGHAYHGSGACYLEQDEELIAKLASSSAPQQDISSWQSKLSLLGSELVKVIFHPSPRQSPNIQGFQPM